MIGFKDDYFDNEYYLETAKSMLNNISPEFGSYPDGFSNWLDLMLKLSDSFYEVAIVGENALIKATEINKNFKPNKLIPTPIKRIPPIPAIESEII